MILGDGGTILNAHQNRDLVMRDTDGVELWRLKPGESRPSPTEIPNGASLRLEPDGPGAVIRRPHNSG